MQEPRARERAKIGCELIAVETRGEKIPAQVGVDRRKLVLGSCPAGAGPCGKVGQTAFCKGFDVFYLKLGSQLCSSG
jgi:hypothetical protein